MLLDIIKARLVSQNVVNTTAWRCFIGFAPDTQDQLVSLHLTGGYAQDTHLGENVLETFQVRVRAGQLEYTACEAKWREVYNALHGAVITASGVRMIEAMASGPLEFFDDRQRPNMTVNFRVVRDKP